MWGLVSKLFARAFSWQSWISPAIIFRTLATGFEQCEVFVILVKGPGIALVINSSENDIIIFGYVLFGAKLEHLPHQA